MRPTRLVVSLVLALIGVVWIGQGTGLIGGSAMSGVAFWAVIGLVLVVVAAVVLVRELRPAER
jgi:hypothetical protein